MNSLKENIIKEYMSSINFRGDWAYEVIEQELAKRLGERPSMDVTYKKDVMIMEGSKKAKEIKVLEKVSIIYTDLDNKIKRYEIKID